MNTTTTTGGNEMTTTTKPLTYGAAAKVATSVNTDELRDLIALDDNPDIFPGKGKTRRVGWNLRINTAGTEGAVEAYAVARAGRRHPVGAPN